MTDKASTESGEDWAAWAVEVLARTPEVHSRVCHIDDVTFNALAASVGTALRHAFTQGERKDKWQPIKTFSQKDRTSVLVYCDSGRSDLQPGDKCAFTAFRDSSKWFHFGGGHQTEIVNVTHWQPLPAPPTQDEKKGGAE